MDREKCRHGVNTETFPRASPRDFLSCRSVKLRARHRRSMQYPSQDSSNWWSRSLWDRTRKRDIARDRAMVAKVFPILTAHQAKQLWENSRDSIRHALEHFEELSDAT